eukprot:GDKI01006569.1.p1 GENE.GDKI01006569.1~~GDKI01006569.1.p1  ORF type:complete len:469 (+),score=46.54 GDKI01006569.1:137-1543(+)
MSLFSSRPRSSADPEHAPEDASLLRSEIRTDKEEVQLFGVGLTQLLIWTVAFTDGLTHLAGLATYYLFKDDLALSPAEVSLIFIAPAIPSIIKPLFAFTSDSYPIFGERRRPYMLIFSFLQAVGYILLAAKVRTAFGAAFALMIIALSSAFCSSIAEGLVVERSGAAGQTLDGSVDIVTKFIGFRALGSFLVAYFSGSLLEHVSKEAIFLTTACFPLLITATAIKMKETTRASGRDTLGQFKEFSKFVQQKIIWGPALFSFLFMATPDYDTAMFFFFTNKLGFSPTFMGALRLTYSVAAMAGIVIYVKFLKNTSFKAILLWSIVAALPIYLSPLLLISGINRTLYIPDSVFVLSGSFLIEALSEFQILPLTILASRICPAGLEATMYAFLMSSRTIGVVASRALSSAGLSLLNITASNFTHLSVWIWICGALFVTPLLLLPMIPEAREAMLLKNEEQEEAKKNIEAAA